MEVSEALTSYCYAAAQQLSNCRNRVSEVAHSALDGIRSAAATGWRNIATALRPRAGTDVAVRCRLAVVLMVGLALLPVSVAAYPILATFKRDLQQICEVINSHHRHPLPPYQYSDNALVVRHRGILAISECGPCKITGTMMATGLGRWQQIIGVTGQDCPMPGDFIQEN